MRVKDGTLLDDTWCKGEQAFGVQRPVLFPEHNFVISGPISLAVVFVATIRSSMWWSNVAVFELFTFDYRNVWYKSKSILLVFCSQNISLRWALKGQWPSCFLLNCPCQRLFRLVLVEWSQTHMYKWAHAIIWLIWCWKCLKTQCNQSMFQLACYMYCSQAFVTSRQLDFSSFSNLQVYVLEFDCIICCCISFAALIWSGVQ